MWVGCQRAQCESRTCHVRKADASALPCPSRLPLEEAGPASSEVQRLVMDAWALGFYLGHRASHKRFALTHLLTHFPLARDSRLNEIPPVKRTMRVIACRRECSIFDRLRGAISTQLHHAAGLASLFLVCVVRDAAGMILMRRARFQGFGQLLRAAWRNPYCFGG
jgi:hypothetical protein